MAWAGHPRRSWRAACHFRSPSPRRGCSTGTTPPTTACPDGGGKGAVTGVLALASVILRVLAALIPELGIPGLHGAAGPWILAHLFFLALYGPMLLKPRVDLRHERDRPSL
ncbi:MAG: NnrS family protein [Rhodospirillum sp.]|nr:NnrS family protein [Rhodospirillum sp.]MCF8492104.1 NnrS family protein [Rhodospirillum sp.]MCF8502086.1 NnrS family protein [Rhodospirillum sp.]